MAHILAKHWQKWVCLFVVVAALLAALPGYAGPNGGLNVESDEKWVRDAGSYSKAADGLPDSIRNAEKADVPPDDETTGWLKHEWSGYARYTNNPADRGYWIDEKGNVKATFWRDVVTNCEPCKPLVESFNYLMNRVLSARQSEAEIPELRDRDLAELQKVLDSVKNGRGDDARKAALALEIQQQMENVHEYARARMQFWREEAARYEKEAQAVASRIAECERQCQGAEGNSGVIIGWGGGGWVPQTPPPGTEQNMVLPFNWQGPYSTCFPCQKLAAALNDLPERAEMYMEDIERDKHFLREALSGLDDKRRKAVDGAVDLGYDEISPSRADIYRQRIAENQEKLNKIRDYFNDVLARLRECERTRCRGRGEATSASGASSGGIGVVPGSTGAGFELEHTVPITGTNPFDAKEIERIPNMVGSASGSSGSSGSASSGSGSGSGSGGGSGSGSGGVVTPPLAISAPGSFSFAHIVGTSPCPQPAGTVTVTSNNGNPLSITGLSCTGSIAPKLTVTATGTSPSPQINVQFNCSSPANGTFTGTVTGTATDTVTGESAPFSIPASGSVSG